METQHKWPSRTKREQRTPFARTYSHTCLLAIDKILFDPPLFDPPEEEQEEDEKAHNQRRRHREPGGQRRWLCRCLSVCWRTRPLLKGLSVCWWTRPSLKGWWVWASLLSFRSFTRSVHFANKVSEHSRRMCVMLKISFDTDLHLSATNWSDSKFGCGIKGAMD